MERNIVFVWKRRNMKLFGFHFWCRAKYNPIYAGLTEGGKAISLYRTGQTYRLHYFQSVCVLRDGVKSFVRLYSCVYYFKKIERKCNESNTFRRYRDIEFLSGFDSNLKKIYIKYLNQTNGKQYALVILSSETIYARKPQDFSSFHSFPTTTKSLEIELVDKETN